MELTGILKTKLDAEQKKLGFFIREFILTSNEEYPQDVLFQLKQNKCDLILDINKGDKIKVYFTIIGKMYTKSDKKLKCYNVLNCYKIERLSL